MVEAYDGKRILYEKFDEEEVLKAYESEFNNALKEATAKATSPREFAMFFSKFLVMNFIWLDFGAVKAVEVRRARYDEIEVWLYCAGFDVKITKHSAEILPKTVYVEHD